MGRRGGPLRSSRRGIWGLRTHGSVFLVALPAFGEKLGQVEGEVGVAAVGRRRGSLGDQRRVGLGAGVGRRAAPPWRAASVCRLRSVTPLTPIVWIRSSILSRESGAPGLAQ